MATARDAEGGTSDTGGHREVTTDPRGDLFDPQCPTRQLLDRIGTKWVSMVVLTLHSERGELRFSELRRRVPGISQKMLSQTLASLRADGLVDRRVEDTVPPAVHYRLTGLGTSLTTPLEHVRDWAEAHMHEIDQHRASGDVGRVSRPPEAPRQGPVRPVR